MNSAKSFLLKFVKFIGIQTTNVVEAISTGICSFAAFFSLFLLDGWLWKIIGFFGFFMLAYLVAYLLDKLKGEA
ncbi:hypothetical protein ABEH22_05475 [Pantoea agglomerans]|jgi:hypothetical protein|uniref:Uncharacterized protein n=2 Tax=Pantoea TaxID=53335 RepID=A0A7X2MID8_ENTAG|nr:MULTISPECIES: hypothetical protein [Pantoea]AYP22014.1 hypothetical protein D0A61_03015 [Pantoea agglomerans]KEY44629.1 hypothetical protein FB99_30810 [Pantoea agglomerans]KGD75492.1 hypothetical protein ID10_13520 [Pantoea agglomerans]MBA5704753.1 hypothetical protein [Pantoea agglomerans]MBA8866113.1 hypothetical protein [Pantoea agglomerans]